MTSSNVDELPRQARPITGASGFVDLSTNFRDRHDQNPGHQVLAKTFLTEWIPQPGKIVGKQFVF